MHSERIKTAHTVHIVADPSLGAWWSVWYIVGGGWRLGYEGSNKREAWELAKLATAARISYKASHSAPGRCIQEATA